MLIMLKRNSINVHSNTAIKSVNRLAVSFSTGDFGIFLNGFAKSRTII